MAGRRKLKFVGYFAYFEDGRGLVVEAVPARAELQSAHFHGRSPAAAWLSERGLRLDVAEALVSAAFDADPGFVIWHGCGRIKAPEGE